MNPQYMPPQFGTTPNFHTNQSSQSLGPPTSQAFQNVPLVTSDSGSVDLSSTNLKSNQFPPSTIGGPFAKPQIPSNQLPPSQGQDLLANNPFNQTSKNENLPPNLGNQHVQNGTSGIQFYIYDNIQSILKYKLNII